MKNDNNKKRVFERHKERKNGHKGEQRIFGHHEERKERRRELGSQLVNLVKEAMKNGVVKERIDYSIDNYWYQTGCKNDNEKIDVFYILSTTLVKTVDKNGKQIFHATLSEEERKIMEDEYKYISTEMFPSDTFNFIAPYYRQLTFEAYEHTEKRIVFPAVSHAVIDICDAFDYYMEHINNGKPFIIAGFSQGGLMAQAILMHMTDEQYSRLIAAYSIGFQVSEKELKNSHIKAATSEDDLGVIISYNSVESTDIMWNQIEGNAAVCMNPLNWKTNDEKAELIYDGDKATVWIDKEEQVLIVKGLDSNKYDGMGYPIAKGIYHMWDPRFYVRQIRENAVHRANKWNS